jgi:hypothetical protein
MSISNELETIYNCLNEKEIQFKIKTMDLEKINFSIRNLENKLNSGNSRVKTFSKRAILQYNLKMKRSRQKYQIYQKLI